MEHQLFKDFQSDPDKHAKLETTFRSLSPNNATANPVPRHKFDGLVDYAVRLERELHEVRLELLRHRHVETSEVWYWQKEGGNYIESLNCQVVIHADDLRKLIGDAEQMEEVESLIDHAEFKGVARNFHGEGELVNRLKAVLHELEVKAGGREF